MRCRACSANGRAPPLGLWLAIGAYLTIELEAIGYAIANRVELGGESNLMAHHIRRLSRW
jgi:hypothetical protein